MHTPSHTLAHAYTLSHTCSCIHPLPHLLIHTSSPTLAHTHTLSHTCSCLHPLTHLLIHTPSPPGMYCTAGKDRTGIITMLTLHVLGATDEEVRLNKTHLTHLTCTYLLDAPSYTLQLHPLAPSNTFSLTPFNTPSHTL